MKKSIVIIFAIIIFGAGGGFIFMRKQKSNEPNNKVQQNTATHSNMAEYNNPHISFQYPSSWKIVKPSGSPDEFVTLEGPTDPNIPLKEFSNETLTHRRLQVYFGKRASQDTCRADCKVYDVITFNNAQAPNAKLVISDWDSQGYAQMLVVTDDISATIGQKIYKMNSNFNGTPVNIFTNIMYNTNSSGGWVTDVPAFEKTSSFKELLTILRSVNIK